MIRHGIVRSRNQHNVTVALDQVSACGKCARGKGCGLRLFHQPDQTHTLLNCTSKIPVEPGQRVSVDISEADRVWVVFVLYAYGIPTAGLLLGAFAGLGIARLTAGELYTDLFTLLGAASGMAGGLIAWKRIQTVLADRCHWVPRSAAICSGDPE